MNIDFTTYLYNFNSNIFGMFKDRFMIKGIPIIILSILLTIGCKNSKDKPGTGPLSKIEFKETRYDFGTIPYESDGTCKFEFINISEVPLVINMVKASCGCTSPEWTKDPFEPGKGGVIKITYNTKIKGIFRKSITVYSNAKNSPVVLFIKGEVTPEKSTLKK
jgi:hypothetical protein